MFMRFSPLPWWNDIQVGVTIEVENREDVLSFLPFLPPEVDFLLISHTMSDLVLINLHNFVSSLYKKKEHLEDGPTAKDDYNVLFIIIFYFIVVSISSMTLIDTRSLFSH